MILRFAIEKDFIQLAQMRWAFRQENENEIAVANFEEFSKIFIEFLYKQSNIYTYWIAEIDGEIVSHIFVSTVALVPRPKKLNDSFAYLTNIYTKPKFRKKGIGTKLLEHIIEWAKKNDFELLLVYPSDEAINFYKSLGFKNDQEIMKLTLRNF